MTQDIVAATTDLADVLEVENAALGALDLAGAARHLPRKQAATEIFAAAQRTAANCPGFDLQKLRRAATRLRAATEENQRLLERAMRVQRQVLGIMAQAARGADPAPRYARSGVYAARPRAAFAISASA